ncbi:arrestin domain-containing protein 3-like [Vanacampus margaritifer]
MTIKHFSIEYDSINSQNVFTNGDTINGRIIVEVLKETSIKSLTLTGKGSAAVCWSQYIGQNMYLTFSSCEKYYVIQQPILLDGTDIITKGTHVFPFFFKVPDRKMPSSFKSPTGNIVHNFNAELKQSSKSTKKAYTHFAFVSKADMDIPGLMEPQHYFIEKKLKVFGSGIIQMDAYAERMGYQSGEDVQVKAEIHNQSSRDVKLKFALHIKQSYFAQGRMQLFTPQILGGTLERIAAHSESTVEKAITIPKGLPPSNLNSSIIKMEYRLVIFLEVKFAKNLNIAFPIVVLPALEGPAG